MATKTTTFIVRQHRPWKALFVVLLLIGGYIGSSYWLYLHAQLRAGFDERAAAARQSDLQQHLAAIKKQDESLRARVAILERSNQIDRESRTQVRDRVRELQDENLELKQELAFFRGIVSPKDHKAGLKIQSFELSSGGAAQLYHYKLILTQVLKNERFAVGTVKLAVKGTLAGQREQLSLAKLDDDGQDSIGFRFKYFQTFEGNLRLPPGFQPQSVSLVVVPTTKGLDRLDQDFPWDLGKP